MYRMYGIARAHGCAGAYMHRMYGRLCKNGISHIHMGRIVRCLNGKDANEHVATKTCYPSH